MADSNVNKPALISEETYNQLQAALVTLHGIAANYGATPLPPTVGETLRAGKAGDMLARCITAAKDLHAAQKEAKVATFRQGVKEVIEAHMEEARAARDYIDAAPASMRDMLRAALPKKVWVPVSEFAPLFPQGTDVVKFMTDTDNGLGIPRQAFGKKGNDKDAPLALVCDIK